jgi:hypothetical protein
MRSKATGWGFDSLRQLHLARMEKGFENNFFRKVIILRLRESNPKGRKATVWLYGLSERREAKTASLREAQVQQFPPPAPFSTNGERV